MKEGSECDILDQRGSDSGGMGEMKVPDMRGGLDG